MLGHVIRVEYLSKDRDGPRKGRSSVGMSVKIRQ